MRTRWIATLAIILGLAACTQTHKPAAHPTPSKNSFGAADFAYLDGVRLWTVRSGVAASVAVEENVTAVASPDGNWIAESVVGGIRIVSAIDPTNVRVAIKVPFNRDVSGAEPRSYRAPLLWADDSRSIAYITQTEPSPLPTGCIYGCPTTYFHVVQADGSGVRVLNHADGDFVLTRFTRGSIFAFATGEGGYYSNLTLIDVGDGSIRDLTPDLFSLQPTSVAVSPDGSTLFYVRVDSRGSRLLKRVLSTKKETVLYSVPPKDRSKGEISIGYVVMPPAGSNLVFARADATGHRERTIEISTTSGRASTLLDTTQNNVVPWHWSQDERFLWMEPGCTGCPESATSDYALDVATKQLHVTWTPTDTSQSINFVGWIR